MSTATLSAKFQISVSKEVLWVACDAHLAGVAGVDCQPKAAHAAQGRR
jgi:hypothetical protein